MSLDEPGSGTLVDAQLILAAAGLSESDITPEYLKPDQAADRMKDGAMDAFIEAMARHRHFGREMDPPLL